MEILDLIDSLQQSFRLSWNSIAHTLFQLMIDYPGGITRTIIESTLEQHKIKQHKLSDYISNAVYTCKFNSGYLIDSSSKVEHFLHSKYLSFIDQDYTMRVTNIRTVTQLENDRFTKYIMPTDSLVFEIPTSSPIISESGNFLEEAGGNMKLYVRIDEIVQTGNVHVIKVSDSSKSAAFIVSKSTNMSNLFSEGEYICFWNPLVSIQNYELILEYAEDSVLFVVKGEKAVCKNYAREFAKSLTESPSVSMFGRIVLQTNMDETGVCDATIVDPLMLNGNLKLGMFVFLSNFKSLDMGDKTVLINQPQSKIVNVSAMQCIPSSSLLHRVIPLRILKSLKLNYFVTRSLIAKYKVLDARLVHAKCENPVDRMDSIDFCMNCQEWTTDTFFYSPVILTLQDSTDIIDAELSLIVYNQLVGENDLESYCFGTFHFGVTHFQGMFRIDSFSPNPPYTKLLMEWKKY
ncbi:hypothetical protein HDV01_000680 [Terramyces sp. JEL0728]|nr:hypothetical protein HDV01_000680 [Terramyces sp. JEL0728]